MLEPPEDSHDEEPEPSAPVESVPSSNLQASSYGPIRRGSAVSKTIEPLFRPPCMARQDFQEALEEGSTRASKRSHSPEELGSNIHVKHGKEQEALAVDELLSEEHQHVDSLVASFLKKKEDATRIAPFKQSPSSRGED